MQLWPGGVGTGAGAGAGARQNERPGGGVAGSGPGGISGVGGGGAGGVSRKVLKPEVAALFRSPFADLNQALDDAQARASVLVNRAEQAERREKARFSDRMNEEISYDINNSEGYDANERINEERKDAMDAFAPPFNHSLLPS